MYVSSYSDLHSANIIDRNKVTSQQAQDFCGFLLDHLPSIPHDLVDCCDPKCNIHYQQLDSLCNHLLECIVRGSSLCFPKVKKVSAVNLRMEHSCSLH